MAGYGTLVCLLAACAGVTLGMGVPAVDMLNAKEKLDMRQAMHWRAVPVEAIYSATNLQEELDHWKGTGNPLFLKFESDTGSHELISVKSIINMEPTADIENVEQYIKFHLFTKFDESDMIGKEFQVDAGMVPSETHPSWMKLVELGFNAKLPTKFIIHDFGKNIKSKDVMLIKNAYLKRGNVNVVMVDWSQLAKIPDYFMARRNVIPAGIRIGKMLDMIAMPTSTASHVIGIGLGAHVAGIAGKTMMHGPLARITALDPARALFERTHKLGLLSEKDAVLVDVIHTNAGGFGMDKSMGLIDFYPNGGRFQPGCSPDVFGTCAHNRAAMYFAESIQDPQGKFKSTLCRTLEEAYKEDCYNGIHNEMGDGDEFKTFGIYYTKTNEKTPFSL